MLADTASGAEAQTYSLFQVVTVSATSVRTQSHADLPGKEVIVLVRRMAKQMHSTTLAQLASQISAMARYGAAKRQFAGAKPRQGRVHEHLPA